MNNYFNILERLCASTPDKPHFLIEWLLETRKPGAPIYIYIDWRQLPPMTVVLQWAGWLWQGAFVRTNPTTAYSAADSVSKPNLWHGGAKYYGFLNQTRMDIFQTMRSAMRNSNIR